MKTAIKSIQASHSTLDEAQLGEFTSATYSIGDNPNCKFHLRDVNDIYKISSPKGHYVLRVHRHNQRIEQSINAEVNLLQHWSCEGLEVSLPIPARSGERLVAINAPEGLRHIMLFKEVSGKENPTPQPTTLRRIGQTLARLHTVAHRLPPIDGLPYYDLEYTINDSANIICDFLHSRPEIRGHGIFYQKLAINLLRRLAEASLKDFSWGPIHGDLIHSKLLFDAKEDITICDFDKVGYGWRAYELASYLGHLCVHRIVPSQSTLFRETSRYLLDGYQSISPLSDEERYILPTLYLVRRLWMRSVYCQQFIDWSNQLLSPSDWRQDAQKAKRWAKEVCGFDL